MNHNEQQREEVKPESTGEGAAPDMGSHDPSGHVEAEVSPTDPAVEEEVSRETFAEMLAEGESTVPVQRRKGVKVTVPVAALSEEWVFVSLGGKEEGTIRREEFAAEERAAGDERPDLPAVGDSVEAYVLSAAAGEVLLTTQLGGRDASLASLEQAWQGGIPVEGQIVRTIKGGFEVRIASVRAFCPLSQIDLRWPKEPKEFEGQTCSFRILEFKDNGRNIVLSRRTLLEEEREQQKAALRESLRAGETVTGRVRSVQKFGAFVDLGGVDALIPVSEMAWTRVNDPSEVVQEGQQVTAKILNVDWEKERISLSLKAMGGDPWSDVAEQYAPGTKTKGRVARLVNFGAFVTLQEGVDGLVHISAMGAGRRIGHPKEVVTVGEEVEVEVLAVDTKGRRVSLSMEHRQRDSLGQLPRIGESLTGEVEKVADFGVFVKLPSGHTGLVPNAEMATERGTDHRRMFQPHDAMEVAVLAVEEAGKRIRLSRKALLRKEERELAAAYLTTGNEPVSLGTLGDLLQAKLNKG